MHMKRRSISPTITFDAESEDAGAGYDLAREVWFSTGEGVDPDEAARRFAEGALEVALVETPEAMSAYLYGAACLFLELAGRPKIKEVPHEQSY